MSDAIDIEIERSKKELFGLAKILMKRGRLDEAYRALNAYYALVGNKKEGARFEMDCPRAEAPAQRLPRNKPPEL